MINMTMRFRILGAIFAALALGVSAYAQGLNWEGQTGAFITPFAYTSDSPADNFGRPQVSFHYLNGGKVLGNHTQYSVTVGAAKRVEFGYTRNVAFKGSTAVFSDLFKNDFNIFHGKVNIVAENAGKTKWVPAISAGFVARTQVKRVGGVLGNKSETNGDVYVVATKTIGEIKEFPILLNVGVKHTNASVFGIAGNAPDWKTRGFAAIAGVIKADKTLVIIGAEAAQQPKYVKGLPGPTIPTTLTYFARIIPKAGMPLNIDVGVAQAAGKISPGIDLKARHQFAMGISYTFK